MCYLRQILKNSTYSFRLIRKCILIPISNRIGLGFYNIFSTQKVTRFCSYATPSRHNKRMQEYFVVSSWCRLMVGWDWLPTNTSKIHKTKDPNHRLKLCSEIICKKFKFNGQQFILCKTAWSCHSSIFGENHHFLELYFVCNIYIN